MKTVIFNKFGISAIVFSFLLTSISCQSKAPQSNEPKEAQSWQGQMNSLSVTLTELIPFLTDSAKFSDPKNSDKVTQLTKKLSGLSHKVKENQKLTGNDPTVGFILAQFEEDAQRAVESLELGHKDYALHLLKNTTSYCIQCHTRTNVGPAFNNSEIEKSISHLHPLQKGEFYAAIREFDKALDEFQKVIKAPRSEQPNVFTWDKASRYSLAISVKFLSNAKRSLEIVDLILNSEHAPYFLKQDAKLWKESIIEWNKESKTVSKKPVTLVSQAEALIKKAELKQKYSTDHSGDIYYLRASSLLHQALNTSSDGKERAEALYLAGLCYESLKDLNFWSIDERYYETCIRIHPHSEIAQKCYQKYEEDVFFGYTGSGGLSLPADIQKTLSELKELSVK